MFKHKIVLITGASRGIGRSCAIEFAKRGATVIINFNQNVDAAELTLKDISEYSPKSILKKFNVSDSNQVQSSINDIVLQFGKIDVLINNAGITRDTLILRMKESDWDDVMSTNLKGVFNCTKAVLKPMIKERFGRIINISSVVGFTGNPGQSNYVTSKAGLVGFTKSVAQEIASRNITVNTIAPGFIITEMTNKLSDSVKNEMLEKIPTKSFGTGEDIAHTALFLSAPESHYITGQIIHVNGGLYM